MIFYKYQVIDKQNQVIYQDNSLENAINFCNKYLQQYSFNCELRESIVINYFKRAII